MYPRPLKVSLSETSITTIKLVEGGKTLASNQNTILFNHPSIHPIGIYASKKEVD